MTPKFWNRVGRIIKLNIYPLKSGHSININQVNVTERGFKMIERNLFQLRDRCCLIYGEDKVGKSARDFPEMVLIRISSHDEHKIVLEAPGMEKIIYSVPNRAEKKPILIKFQSWSEENIPTLDCGDEVAQWLSKYLSKKEIGLRLGYYDDTFQRTFDQYSHKEEMLGCHKFLSDRVFGLYADMASISLFNYRSLLDLNKKLDKNVTEDHFRPNIVVDDDSLAAFSEETWEWIKIGEVLLKLSKECIRCIMITIDPETGIPDPKKEPLETLSRYRSSNKDPKKLPAISIYLEVKSTGIINIGDEVYIGKECECSSENKLQ